MAEPRRVAGFRARHDGTVIARVTGFSLTSDISEEEVSGLNNTVGDPPIIQETYLAQSVGKTASINGVSILNDTGQSRVEDSADAGSEIVLEYRYDNGEGYDLTGFFTSHERTGDKGEISEKFSADFRVNDKTWVSGT